MRNITLVVFQSLSHVQLFVTPWTDYSLPSSSVHGIYQARILEWVVISLSGDLPDPGIKPTSPAWQVDSLPLSHLGSSAIPYICMPISSLFLDFLPIQVTTEYYVEFPALYSMFSLIIYFIHSSVYMSVTVSQFIPPFCPHPWYPKVLYVCVLYVCVSVFALT